MSYTIEFTKPASRDFKNLANKVAEQIVTIIDAMEEDPFAFDTKKLKRPIAGYRTRSGNYRILRIIKKKFIVIYSIKHRMDAHKL